MYSRGGKVSALKRAEAKQCPRARRLPLWPRGTSVSKPPEHDPPDYPLFQRKPYQPATGEAEAKDIAKNILDELGPADAAIPCLM